MTRRERGKTHLGFLSVEEPLVVAVGDGASGVLGQGLFSVKMYVMAPSGATTLFISPFITPNLRYCSAQGSLCGDAGAEELGSPAKAARGNAAKTSRPARMSVRCPTFDVIGATRFHRGASALTEGLGLATEQQVSITALCDVSISHLWPLVPLPIQPEDQLLRLGRDRGAVSRASATQLPFSQ